MTRTTTLAALAMLFSATGCAMGQEAGSDDIGRASAPSRTVGKGGAAGQGGQGGQGGSAGRGGDAGNPGRAGAGGAESCPDKCQGSEACGNNCDDDCDGVVDQNCSGNNCSDQCQDAEVCGNNCDDDCDGKVDEDCTFPCEDTDGHGCNGDDGHGDHCDPSENENGCSQAKFWAWCNRRNDKYPNIWDDYLAAWVRARCDGTIELQDVDDNGYEEYVCRDSDGRTWQCTTPLVLSFDGGPVQFSSAPQHFALGGGEAVAWPGANTPWLALDRDGNGLIDGGGELFGSSTMLGSGAAARNGFEALAGLDDNGDGRIDGRDRAWSSLLVWSDANSDGRSQSSELSGVAARGLVSISLRASAWPHCDGAGNCEGERASFTWLQGGQERTGEVVDVYLRMR